MTQPAADWLDLEPRKRTRKSKRARAAKKAKKLEIVAGNAIPREAARRFGEGRIWGCDGTYVFFRPKRMVDGVFTQVANPEAMERHERFLRAGHYEYVETQDDVQIFRVTELSPFKRKFGSLLEMSPGQIRRAIIMAAVKGEWTLYVDALEELAVRIKETVIFSDGQSGGQLAVNQYTEMLAYIEIQIAMRGGPTAAQCGMHLAQVRAARRGGGEKRILVA